MESLESRLLDTLHVSNPPPQAGSILTVTASGMIDVWDFQRKRLAEEGICGLIIRGLDETDDTLVVDLSRGDLPIPVTFHGGAGGYDTPVISGIFAGTYAPGVVFGDSTIQVGATLISFTGLEPVFIDGASTGTSTFTFITPGMPTSSRLIASGPAGTVSPERAMGSKVGQSSRVSHLSLSGSRVAIHL